MKPLSEKVEAAAEGVMKNGGGDGDAVKDAGDGDAVKDAGDVIQGCVGKYAGGTLEAELANNPGDKLQDDAGDEIQGETLKADLVNNSGKKLQTVAGDEIKGYVVRYAGETLKAELVNDSRDKLQADAGDQIQGYVVKYDGETLKADIVDKSEEKLQVQADAGETHKPDHGKADAIKALVGETSTVRVNISIQADSSGTLKSTLKADAIKAVVGEAPTVRVNISIQADSSGTLKSTTVNADDGGIPKAEPTNISTKADAPKTPKAKSIKGNDDVETVKNIDEEEGEEGDERAEYEEEKGVQSDEEEESYEEQEGDAVEINSTIELKDALQGWVRGRLLIRVRRLPTLAEAERMYSYVKTVQHLVEVTNIEVLKMVSDLVALIEFKVIKATIPTLREHPQQDAARGYLAKQGRQITGRALQIGGEFSARAEAVGNAMQAHSQLVNEPPYSVALNNLRKTINALLNSPVTLD